MTLYRKKRTTQQKVRREIGEDDKQQQQKENGVPSNQHFKGPYALSARAQRSSEMVDKLVTIVMVARG